MAHTPAHSVTLTPARVTSADRGPAIRALVAAYRAVIRVVEVFLAAQVVLLAVIVPLGVLFRYALRSALTWTDEIGGLLLVWITFYGSVIALDRGTHLDFDLLVSRMPRPWNTVARAITDGALAVLLLVILANGWTIMTRLMNQTIVSLPIPRGFFYSVMPISAILMLIVLAARWLLPDATSWDRKRHRVAGADAAEPAPGSSTE